tara:strand:+ start:7872 stop:9053 length:1182 start_codon:yes stop_codon:yes gene_type:complete
MAGDLTWMEDRYEELKGNSLLWQPPTLETANTPRCVIDGKPTIMLSANNYLNLTTHPKVVNASIEAIKKYGAGSGSVRAIAGTMDIHLQAEKKVAEFKGVESSLIYSAGYTANVGLIPSLVKGKEDIIISDELNHGSIIDGVRLTKAQRAVFPHNDMGALEQVLKENESADRKLVIVDGVFSMDGDICPLDELTAIAEDYNAMVFVDDCHGEGVLGDGGRGIVDHFKLQGRVDIEGGSFSKALGVQGGIIAGKEIIRNHALNHSRSWLLSGSQPPGVAAAQKAAVEVLMNEPEHHAKLWENTEYFRKEMQDIGFDTGVSTTPIIPVMCGDSNVAKSLSETMLKNGVMAGAIVFPMVARDKARVRTQMSAGLTRDDLDEVLRIFEKSGKEVGLI